MSQLRDFPSCTASVAQLDWECGPVGQTRDSDILERSNFDHVVALFEALDPDAKDWECITWRHWACGWVEEIFTRPGSPVNMTGLEIRLRLLSYPGALDEERLAQYELEELETMTPEENSDAQNHQNSNPEAKAS